MTCFMTYRLIIHAAALALIAWLSPVCIAESRMKPAPGCSDNCVTTGEWQLGVAVGLGGRTNPIRDESDTPYIVLPQVSYYGKRFFLENFDLGYTLVDRPHHQLHALFFTPSLEQGFFDSSSLTNFSIEGLSTTPPDGNGGINISGETLNPGRTPVPSTVEFDLRKRKFSGFSGLEYVYVTPWFDVQLQALTDITGVHNGNEYRAAINTPLKIGKNDFLFSLGVTQQSAKLLDYYYGVDASEVSDVNYAYQTQKGSANFVRLNWKRALSKNWQLKGLLSYKQLSDAVNQSPLVIEDHVMTIFIGGVYHF